MQAETNLLIQQPQLFVEAARKWLTTTMLHPTVWLLISGQFVLITMLLAVAPLHIRRQMYQYINSKLAVGYLSIVMITAVLCETTTEASPSR